MTKNEILTNTAYQRVIGDFPKIGIRPAIDGRMRGVRESLEEQTINMAKNAAQLISANLKYPDGKPVECVIADSCIGGVAEAAMCAEKFSKSGVGVSLTVTPCWCYGSETIDMDPGIPKAIWGFNGTERPGAVYLAAALAGLRPTEWARRHMHLASMVMMFRTQETSLFLPTSAKKY